MKQSKKEIEYGVDNPTDRDLNRQFAFSQTETDYDGKVKKTRIVKKQVRNRVIDKSIPEGEDGRVTYTDWENVKD